MGNLVSERVISVDELAAEGRFFEAPAERTTAPVVSAPVVYETFVEPAMEYVTSAPAVEYISSAPAVEYFSSAPMVEYVTGAPMTYVA
jgi:hypothetical protein